MTSSDAPMGLQARLSDPPPSAEVRPEASLFDNPRARARVEQAYSMQNAVLGVAIPALVTAVTTGLHALGWAPSVHSGPVYLLPWLLVALHGPTIAISATMLRRGEARGFAIAYAMQSLVQILWLLFTCWFATPAFTAIGLIIAVSWVFNDAWVFYGTRASAWPYLASIPIFDASLLLLDRAGHDGLLALLERSRQDFTALLVVEAFAAFIAYFVLRHLGQQFRETDEGLLRGERAASDLALVRREREVLQLASGLLSRGLVASKFSHDVAGPLTVQGLVVSELERQVTSALANADVPRPQVREIESCLADLGESVRLATQMCHALSDGVRKGEVAEGTSIDGVWSAAVEGAMGSLAGHNVSMRAALVDIEPSEVWVPPGMAGTIGNLVCNGVLQRPDVPLEVRGRRASEFFYVLSIRDHGVEGEARALALRRIRRRISLEAEAHEPDAPRPAYHGKGIALTMAKILLTSSNGWLTYLVPEGPGLECRLVLPTVKPELIPESENTPSVLAMTSALDAGEEDDFRRSNRDAGETITPVATWPRGRVRGARPEDADRAVVSARAVGVVRSLPSGLARSDPQ